MDNRNEVVQQQSMRMEKNKSRNKVLNKEQRVGYLLVLPTIITICVVSLYPILRTVWLSLHSMQLQFMSESKFIGLGNYKFLLSDSRFWHSLSNTAFFTVISVALELVFGILIALLINKPFRGRGLVRASVLIPWAVPTVVAAMMWKFIYDDQLGILNDILVKVGILDSYRTFLGTESSAMWSMIFADVWKTTPFMALLLLGGLQTISKDIYESAEIDGANKIRQFFYLTLPLLKPTILVALLFRTLDAFRVFDLPWVLTGGTVESLSIYAYQSLFTNLDFGLGSALSFSVFIFVMLISLFYIKVLGVKR
ncbi:ABC-type sugar transport system permease subunit [Bacillus sp. SLBN-46]|uniref:carbohydrate ABC transporter permease n=1 Tax=Bacillus sp. SLBN-46 TaxID=3042283 RepID=UPI00286259FF|nr:sugar ABC transporter permease [Bacillus sp. SLBN-46]MDR6125287.1 ABC-type sugar transport system permease subunit [Bacillus sp. SLBN-46]